MLTIKWAEISLTWFYWCILLVECLNRFPSLGMKMEIIEALVLKEVKIHVSSHSLNVADNIVSRIFKITNLLNIQKLFNLLFRLSINLSRQEWIFLSWWSGMKPPREGSWVGSTGLHWFSPALSFSVYGMKLLRQLRSTSKTSSRRVWLPNLVDIWLHETWSPMPTK